MDLNLPCFIIAAKWIILKRGIRSAIDMQIMVFFRMDIETSSTQLLQVHGCAQLFCALYYALDLKKIHPLEL